MSSLFYSQALTLYLHLYFYASADCTKLHKNKIQDYFAPVFKKSCRKSNAAFLYTAIQESQKTASYF